ncbi:MAG: YmdB family metallophosphoesterase [Candidatus Kerfeldbacteria bacterium]|nr:YmdB family metallophosphoesterase [Candidatus Kerfeldbacteria bacterium]
MNTLRVLYFGDVVGRHGRLAVTKALQEWKEELAPDLICANVENLAHGFGITESTIRELEAAGVHIMTSGNHIYDNDAGVQFLRDKNPKNVIKPANYHESTPGARFATRTVKGAPVLVVNLLGQTFMPEEVASPFETVKDIVDTFASSETIVIIDLHAEATGEKYAMKYFIEGKASLLVGTHTHIVTADEHISTGGLGFICDIGFSGAADSSLGMDAQRVLHKVVYNQPVHLEPPQEASRIVARAVVCDIDIATKKAVRIARVDRTYNV